VIKTLAKLYSKPTSWLLSLVVFFALAFLLTFSNLAAFYASLLGSSISVTDKFSVLGNIFLSIFTNVTSLQGACVVVISLIQSVAVSAIVYIKLYQPKVCKIGKKTGAATIFGSVLMFFTVGCTACGTSVLLPVLTLILGTVSASVAGAVSSAILVVAFVLSLVATAKLLNDIRKGDNSND
jgi:hypothetical protein